MKSIEDLIVDKLYTLVNYILTKTVKPDIEVNTVRDLNEQTIAELKQKFGIEAVILDVDDTLRREMKVIPDCNKEWIEKLKEQLKVIIVSNGKDNRVEEFLKTQGIDYIGVAHKPLKMSFIKACQKLGVEPERVLVVGNDLFDDIYGGRRNNMKTALVRDVEDGER